MGIQNTKPTAEIDWAINPPATQNEQQTLSFSGIAASGVFKLSLGGILTPDINWNDSAATIAGKINTVYAPGTATGSGSIAAQSVVIDFGTFSQSNLVPVMVVPPADNTLETGASAPITVTAVISQAGQLPAIVAIDNGHLEDGWHFLEKPPFNLFNWWMNLVAQWKNFLYNITPPNTMPGAAGWNPQFAKLKGNFSRQPWGQIGLGGFTNTPLNNNTDTDGRFMVGSNPALAPNVGIDALDLYTGTPGNAGDMTNQDGVNWVLWTGKSWILCGVDGLGANFVKAYSPLTDARASTLLATVDPGVQPNVMCFDGANVWVGCNDGSLRVYDPLTLALVHNVPAFAGSAITVIFPNVPNSGGPGPLPSIVAVNAANEALLYRAFGPYTLITHFTVTAATVVAGVSDGQALIWFLGDAGDLSVVGMSFGGEVHIAAPGGITNGLAIGFDGHYLYLTGVVPPNGPVNMMVIDEALAIVPYFAGALAGVTVVQTYELIHIGLITPGTQFIKQVMPFDGAFIYGLLRKPGALAAWIIDRLPKY